MKSFRSKEDQVNRISKSGFVTNFPDSFGSRDLWSLCEVYGKVVDVFIPNRKSKAGKRFAFVRFIRVEDMDRLIGNLCTLWVGRFHLHANANAVIYTSKPSPTEVTLLEVPSPFISTSLVLLNCKHIIEIPVLRLRKQSIPLRDVRSVSLLPPSFHSGSAHQEITMLIQIIMVVNQGDPSTGKVLLEIISKGEPVFLMIPMGTTFADSPPCSLPVQTQRGLIHDVLTAYYCRLNGL
ncbi:RNA-directed DNA polymerase, eukaryota, nucleotide-binding alpha-beta plait domain protein [Tanacetum coccineum]